MNKILTQKKQSQILALIAYAVVQFEHNPRAKMDLRQLLPDLTVNDCQENARLLSELLDTLKKGRLTDKETDEIGTILALGSAGFMYSDKINPGVPRPDFEKDLNIENFNSKTVPKLAIWMDYQSRLNEIEEPKKDNFYERTRG